MRNDSESNRKDRQPEEWEDLLQDVTVERDGWEKTCDPVVLSNVYRMMSFHDLMEMRPDFMSEKEKERKVKLVKRIVENKTKGLVRKSLLLLLSTGATNRRIAEMLGVGEDRVHRAVRQGIDLVKKFLQDRKTGSYHTPAGQRPSFRAAVFPLDTEDEQGAFQAFLNREIVIHLSYRGDDLFREVLVVFLKNKRATSLQKTSPSVYCVQNVGK